MSGPWSQQVSTWYESHGPDAATVARYGLGVTILLAGIHKLLVPSAWTVYLIEPLEPIILLSPVHFMLGNGVLEIVFGLAIIADRWTLPAVAVVVVSLAGTATYLSVVAVLRGGQFVDILIRDLGLTALALTVLLQHFRIEKRQA
jgi:hypothetical protein